SDVDTDPLLLERAFASSSADLRDPSAVGVDEPEHPIGRAVRVDVEPDTVAAIEHPEGLDRLVVVGERRALDPEERRPAGAAVPPPGGRDAPARTPGLGASLVLHRSPSIPLWARATCTP